MKYIDVKFNIDGELNEVEMEKAAKLAYNSLTENKKGKMTGWLKCDNIVSSSEKTQIKKIAAEVSKNA